MPVLVSLLRGVNVGGHHKINMDALRTLCESLGLRHVQTHVQSGNVVFLAPPSKLPNLAARIETAIEKSCGFRPSAILRTTDELRDVVARNPFAARPDVPPNRLLVTFLAADPGPEARDRVRAIKTDPEELHIDGRELYIFFPDGIGRSKLPQAAIDKALQTPGTARNWNSVTQLLEMAEKLEALEPR